MKIPPVNITPKSVSTIVSALARNNMVKKAVIKTAVHTQVNNAQTAFSAVMVASAMVSQYSGKVVKMISPQPAKDVFISRIPKNPDITVRLKQRKVPLSADKTPLMRHVETYDYRLHTGFEKLLLDNKKHKNPLNNKAGVFIVKSKKYGVNPVVLMAIAMHESARGTSEAAKLKHNVGGVMGKKSLKHFKNVDTCIEEMAQIVSHHHQESNLNTVEELARSGKYCAKSSAKEWSAGVMYYVKTLLG